MICSNCQTELPDEAIACWKCGEQMSCSPAKSAKHKDGVDPLLVILTLLFSVAFFVCLGWAIPFTIWGNIITVSKDHPEWSALLDMVSGIAFYVSAVGLFIFSWWGSYKLVFRLMKAS